MRMKCLRILPETMPRISCSELSSLSLNIALGSAVVTVASTSIGSDLATMRLSAGLAGAMGHAAPFQGWTAYGMGKPAGGQGGESNHQVTKPRRETRRGD